MAILYNVGIWENSTTASNNNWSNPQNWINGVVPGLNGSPNDTAIFPKSINSGIILDQDIQLNNLYILDSGSIDIINGTASALLTITSDLYISSGSNLTSSSPINLASDITLSEVSWTAKNAVKFGGTKMTISNSSVLLFENETNSGDLTITLDGTSRIAFIDHNSSGDISITAESNPYPSEFLNITAKSSNLTINGGNFIILNGQLESLITSANSTLGLGIPGAVGGITTTGKTIINGAISVLYCVTSPCSTSTIISGALVSCSKELVNSTQCKVNITTTQITATC